MAKNNNREELLERENHNLKEILAIETELAEMNEPDTGDGFENLRNLLKPPKVDIGFYIGKMPRVW